MEPAEETFHMTLSIDLERLKDRTPGEAYHLALQEMEGGLADMRKQMEPWVRQAVAWPHS